MFAIETVLAGGIGPAFVADRCILAARDLPLDVAVTSPTTRRWLRNVGKGRLLLLSFGGTDMEAQVPTSRTPWNKGKLVGQKAPLKPKDVWSIRVHLQMEHRARELALFNLGFDSKLRGCDLVALRVRDVSHGDRIANRAMVMQSKTRHPVQFEITPTAREALEAWIKRAHLRSDDFLFPSRLHSSEHIGTRQYARILRSWVEDIGLDPADYGTHSMRRSKASMIYKKTKNLRAVQILLGHTKLESTVRYLGIEVDDALDIAEQIDV
jgi:hypothetical protein